MTLTAGKALRFYVPANLTNTNMSKSAQLKITVTQARPRKPKVQSSESKQYTNQLLDLIENPEFLSKLETPDLFVSVIASAVRDLSNK